MPYEEYENEMIDTVNRHAEEQVTFTGDLESKPAPKKSVFTKTDARTLKQGLKRMLVALFTAGLFTLSVFDFIAVAKATGYWAVLCFFAAIIAMVLAFVLLYAQGIAPDESKGDDK